MFVRPAPGLKVRRADTLALLPEAGEDVPDAAWCNRRLRDGDVLEGAAKPVETNTTAAPAESPHAAAEPYHVAEPSAEAAPQA